MTRLKKELTAKGILFEADDMDIMRGAEYDEDRTLVAITDKFIITKYSSAVLPSEIHLFDRFTFNQIALQNLIPDNICMSFGSYHNKWESYVLSTEEQENSVYGLCV